jgi:hypothetical protein
VDDRVTTFRDDQWTSAIRAAPAEHGCSCQTTHHSTAGNTMQTSTSPMTAGKPSPSVRPRLRTCIAVIVTAAAAAGGLASQATAAPQTVKVKGTFKNPLVTGPGCDSPVGLCFEGRFHGSLNGPDEGVVNSLTPTQTPDVSQGQADLTIHDKRGDLTCSEEFVLNTSPTGDGQFAFLCEITGGTGRYAGASGYLQGAGITPPATATSTGAYVGVIKLQ